MKMVLKIVGKTTKQNQLLVLESSFFAVVKKLFQAVANPNQNLQEAK